MATNRIRKKMKPKMPVEQRIRQALDNIEKLRLVLVPGALPACPACHSERRVVARRDIPAENWKKLTPLLAQLPEQGLTPRQVVYCPTCGDYAVLGD